MNYKTPGVYIEEVSSLAPSVAPLSTAIPAFIGYTEKHPSEEGVEPSDKKYVTVRRITTIIEYEEIFGGPEMYKVAVNIEEGKIKTAGLAPSVNSIPTFLMHYNLNLYFQNGGGPCYIVSIGNYSGGKSTSDFELGLAALRKEDEPTLIVISDAYSLELTSYGNLVGQSLKQCADLKSRFLIAEAFKEKEVNDPFVKFRESLGKANLDYGATYYPLLATSISIDYDKKQEGAVTELDQQGKSTRNTIEYYKDTNTSFYNQILAALSKVRVVLPPGGAIAGAYARTDNDRGVWKAPANVSLSGVLEPMDKINDSQQEAMNIDPTTGKSINAIRAFPGKGILVWGSRTLKGNDNEWRYVPVRRLFIFIEQSLKKATEFAVFEPNVEDTWNKVKSMADSFLYGLWQQGALMGAAPAEAYIVNVGLGTTMTPTDILEGRMKIKIGVAAVRPAEFIILSFSHKLQE